MPLIPTASGARVLSQLDTPSTLLMGSPHSQITSDAHLHEPLEGCGFHLAPHNHHHLVCQLDVWLPAKVATR